MMTDKRRDVPEYGFVRVWTGRYVTVASCDKCSDWNPLDANYCGHCGERFRPIEKGN